MRTTAVVLSIFLAASGCHRQPKETTTMGSASTLAPPAPEQPLPKLQATSGGIAMNNLDAQIESAEKRSDDRAVRASLVDLLLSRGQYAGRIADYERAEAIAEQLVTEAPTEAGSHVARASTRSTFHEFDAALADLADAERLGAKPDKLVGARAAIFTATGKLDEALALRPLDEATPVVMDLATTGLLLGDMGKTADAERLLNLARTRYHDVSPFPYAWMDQKQGALYERLGRFARAKVYYARAVSLLPQYATAAAHLAALSPPAEAITLLEPLTATSDDPEVLTQLSDALRRSGRGDEAKLRLDEAIARYGQLVERHPLAFADHAAIMWLGPGKDPAKALALAKINLDNRKTAEAYELVLQAAIAAKNERSVCGAAKDGLALQHAPETLRSLAQLVVDRCS